LEEVEEEVEERKLEEAIRAKEEERC